MTRAGQRMYGQIAWVSAGRLVAAVLQAVGLVLVARWAGPDRFGALSVVLGIATVAQTTADLGLSTHVVRERAASPHSGAVRRALVLNDRVSLVLGATAALALLGVGAGLDRTYLALLPLAVWLAAERNADAWLGVAIADGDARLNVASLLGRRLLLLLGVLALTAAGVDPLLAYAGTAAVAALTASFSARRAMLPRLPAAAAVPLRSVLRETWPYWLNSLATQARNLDVLVVAALAGAAQTGYYSLASRVTSPLRILPTSMATVLVPAASGASADELRPLVSVVRRMVLCMTALYVALALLVPVGLPLLLGPAYANAVGPAQVVVLGLPFAASASLLGALLQARGAKTFVAQVALGTTLSCLACVAWGAAEAGALGAAAGLASSFLLQSGVLVVRLVRVMHHDRADDPVVSA